MDEPTLLDVAPSSRAQEETCSGVEQNESQQRNYNPGED